MSHPAFEWRTWCQERSRVFPLIREPLHHYWGRLFRFEQDRLKLTLQYFLNIDSNVPYEQSRRYPELKSKPFEPHPLFRSFIEAAIQQIRPRRVRCS